MQQKVLLINPSSDLISQNHFFLQFAKPIPPAGLGYIASVLRQDGVNVRIIDQYAEKISLNKLLDVIKAYKPDIIGVSCITFLLKEVRYLCELIKRDDKNINIVIGNVHATYFPEETLRYVNADAVIRGEGEYAMRDYVRALANNSDLRSVLGLTFKSGDVFISNPDRPLITDLDALPYPAWDLINLDNYKGSPLICANGARSGIVFASRGCPYSCYYCSQDSANKKFRSREVNKVIDEIELGYEKHNFKYTALGDAYFPFSEEQGMEFCDKFIQRNLHKKVRWITETRVDKVSAKLLRKMKDAGAHLIMYGIEVGNAGVLSKLNKKTTLEQAVFALKETRRAGILSLGFFMLGLPWDTQVTCQDTINFAKKLDCDIVKFSMAVPYPGSDFFNDFSDKDTVFRSPEKYNSWYDWLDKTGDLAFKPPNLTFVQLRRIQRQGMLKFYLRPRIIARHILKRTITLENMLLGGFWLFYLVIVGLLKGLRRK